MPLVDARQVTDYDRDAWSQALAVAGLPLDGLFDVPTSVFCASEGSSEVAWAALEHHGDAGLVRSVVVLPERRHSGVGSVLMDAVEVAADERGLPLYLLTETAADFFAGRGYRRIPRDGAPPAVMESIEWAVACGDSAVPMVRAPRRSG